MNMNSNKFRHVLVNFGGRQQASAEPSNPYARGSWRGERPELELGHALSVTERALMGTIGRPWA